MDRTGLMCGEIIAHRFREEYYLITTNAAHEIHQPILLLDQTLLKL
jgi:hypothetical protein